MQDNTFEVSKFNIGRIMQMLRQRFKPETAVNGFRSTGLHPFNFNAVKFPPAMGDELLEDKLPPAPLEASDNVWSTFNSLNLSCYDNLNKQESFLPAVEDIDNGLAISSSVGVQSSSFQVPKVDPRAHLLYRMASSLQRIFQQSQVPMVDP